MIINIEKNKLPNWLKGSEFAEPFDDDDIIEIDDKYFKENRKIENFDDFKKLIKVADFWGVDKYKYLSKIKKFARNKENNYEIMYYLLKNHNLLSKKNSFYKTIYDELNSFDYIFTINKIITYESNDPEDIYFEYDYLINVTFKIKNVSINLSYIFDNKNNIFEASKGINLFFEIINGKKIKDLYFEEKYKEILYCKFNSKRKIKYYTIVIFYNIYHYDIDKNYLLVSFDSEKDKYFLSDSNNKINIDSRNEIVYEKNELKNLIVFLEKLNKYIKKLSEL